MANEKDFQKWYGTTIVSVRKKNEVVVAGDGQVTLGDTVIKANAKKVRILAEGKVITGFAGATADDSLAAELRQWTRTQIGPIATPDLLQWAPQLPKTRSGKIMRRILRKIAANEYSQLGDTSTLTDPAVVDDLVDNRQNR